MDEFVYSIYEGFNGVPVMDRARVVKRTAKRLSLLVDKGNGAAFRWSSQAPHGRYATSPENAIDRYHTQLQSTIAHYEASIDRAKRNLAATPKRIYKETGGNQAAEGHAVTPSASEAPERDSQ